MNIVWLIFLTALGACVGSFLNVVIYRLPRGESIVFPGSHCPSCGWAIKWYDNIPLVSWFALGGRCRRCRVAISPRYVIVEAATALRVGGLFVCYYVLALRQGAGEFPDTWPMFAAHAALLCGLFACAVVDAEHFHIPLEIMWVCSAAGLLVGAASPRFEYDFLPRVSPTAIGVSVAAAVGLLVSLFLLRRGYLQPSFLDAEEAPPAQESGPREAAPPRAGGAPATRGAPRAAREPSPVRAAGILHIVFGTITGAALAYVPGAGGSDEEARNVALSPEHGVQPRREILWEIAFLLPALVLAGAAGLVLRHVPAAGEAWGRLFSDAAHPHAAPHLAGLGSALFGYLVGGLWVWATRILGTLALNKEAMGLGDVHILAAVGAVTGWIVPSLTFFVAPFIGLGWALYVWLGRKQRVVAYGPLLATGTLVVMLFYDGLVGWLEPLFTRGQ